MAAELAVRQTAVRSERKSRHTKRDALQAIASLGASDPSVGAFIHRLRTAGLADDRIGQLLGFPPDADPKSVRIALNRWEKADGFRSVFDAQARADVTHARNRWCEAAARVGSVCSTADMTDRDLADLFFVDTELSAPAIAAVEAFLACWIEWWRAEVKANLLNLPREVMPGAISISWDQIQRRIGQLQAIKARDRHRQIVAGYIQAAERERQHITAQLGRLQAEMTRKTEAVLSDLAGHPEAGAILSVLEDRPDAIASQDALGRMPIKFDESLLHGPEIQRKRPLRWGDREHVSDRDRRLMLFEQSVTGGLRIAIPTKRR